MKSAPQYRYDEPISPRRERWLIGLALFLVAAAIGWYAYRPDARVVLPLKLPTPTPVTQGRLLSVESTQHFSAEQAAASARENYGATMLPVTAGVTKVTFRYQSADLDGQKITVYGRAYLPQRSASTKLPIFAFAPGTTGIGDRCAGSLENPKVANWANYDSHMLMYASQGYAVVITDYEGMRDDGRLHHYMVGELEGRAVLDSVRALGQLGEAKNRLDEDELFLAGYSQGGHAAYWADKIQPQYAPELKPKGIIGFGPVMSVKQTLADVTRSANINWFGPYVLTSYLDYYRHDYDTSTMLLPQWTANLRSDVTSHCIDTNIPFWGADPNKAYQPAFLEAMRTGVYTGPFEQIGADMDANLVGDQKTATAKRINQGQNDNVVLAAQQQAVLPTLCANSRGPVNLTVYPGATHYSTMARSFRDTLGWMSELRSGQTPASTCKG